MSSKTAKCKSCGAEIAKNAKACPRCGAKNAYINPINAAAAIFFLIFFSVLVLKLAGSASPSPTEKVLQKPELTVSSISLWKAYSDNKVSADETYNGKWIAVSGKISDITQDVVSKNPCVSIDSGDGLNLYPIECFFSGESESDNDILASLEDGQDITIVGKCEGTPLLRVQLSDCHF
ncbi:OB-fold protein [Oscillibacter sp.]|uniref:OB-fold protein n=1 Tax=Oscillibacter sp. TaxID=1945593 RepID=UPI00289E2CD8|nr:zinc-ribbon domain-containing protein [Oscillibacter sp.]